MGNSNWTSEDLEALDNIIKKAEEEVQFKDRRVKYRSVSELVRIRELMANSIKDTKGKIKPLRSKYSSGIY